MKTDIQKLGINMYSIDVNLYGFEIWALRHDNALAETICGFDNCDTIDDVIVNVNTYYNDLVFVPMYVLDAEDDERRNWVVTNEAQDKAIKEGAIAKTLHQFNEDVLVTVHKSSIGYRLDVIYPHEYVSEDDYYEMIYKTKEDAIDHALSTYKYKAKTPIILEPIDFLNEVTLRREYNREFKERMSVI